MCSTSSRTFQPGPRDLNPPVRGLTCVPPRFLPGSPYPLWVYKGEAEAEESVQLSAQTDCPPPLLYQQNSLDKHALLQAALASGTPPVIFPSYPGIGHVLPPHSAASFKRAASPGPTARSPP